MIVTKKPYWPSASHPPVKTGGLPGACIDYRCGVLEKPEPQEEGEDDDLEEVDETEQANIPLVSGA
jgi:hypothetical protein